MSDTTRERILDTAERLFARHGFDGTSLRGIIAEAGVNMAAVHYHFGSRDGLLRAVVDRVIVPLTQHRLRLLDEALAATGGGPLALETILAAFIRPDLVAIEELRARNPQVAQLIGRTYGQPTPQVRQMMGEQFASCGQRFLPELRRSLPHLSAGEIRWRLDCLVGVLIGLFARIEPPGEPDSQEDSHDGDLETTLARIIAFVAPGMAAPAVDRPLPAYPSSPDDIIRPGTAGAN